MNQPQERDALPASARYTGGSIARFGRLPQRINFNHPVATRSP
jgi:hypothetical protein